MASTDIIIATREITGGTKEGKAVLHADAELTGDKQKALGLSKDDVAGLLDSGALLKVSARISDEGAASGGGKLQAALDAANAKIAELEAALAEATKPADPKA
jgi:hypothetical protein